MKPIELSRIDLNLLTVLAALMRERPRLKPDPVPGPVSHPAWLRRGGDFVKVVDFGIARVIQESGGEKFTKTGISIGTAALSALLVEYGRSVGRGAGQSSLTRAPYRDQVSWALARSPSATRRRRSWMPSLPLSR